MRPISKKQSVLNRKLHAVYSEIAQEREPICEACGYALPLSHSHVISQKRCKILHKPELIYDKANIFLECFGYSNSCHEKTESLNYERMRYAHNFQKKMELFEKHDPQTFNKLKMQMT